VPDRQISRILIIERNDHTRALLQCRLPPQLKIKFTPSMEAASEKFRKRRYDLIVWNACSDSASGIDLTSSLDFLSGKASGAKTIVFTAGEMAHGSLPCEGHIAFKKHPSSEEEFLSVIESSLPVTSYGAPTRGAHDEAVVKIYFTD